MDARLEQVARTALQKLSGPGAGAGLPSELRLGTLTLTELSRLAYLQAEDPLVEKVLAMLRAGRPVYLDRPSVEAALGLASYPPRIQEQFARWFVRISGYGVALTGASSGTAAPGPAPKPPTAASPRPPFIPPPAAAPAAPDVRVLPVITPDRQLFSEILGDAVPEPHACVKEPGQACCGSGRCKTLGF